MDFKDLGTHASLPFTPHIITFKNDPIIIYLCQLPPVTWTTPDLPWLAALTLQ